MPTISLKIVNAKKRIDSSHIIRISIAHNGQTRYINTGVTVDNINQFQGGMIVNRRDAAFKNTLLRSKISEIEAKITKLLSVCSINGLSCSELVAAIQRDRPENITLTYAFEEYIDSARLSKNSVTLMKQCFKSIQAALGDDFLLDKLQYQDLLKLEKSLRKIRNSESTIRTKLALLQKIYSYAKKCKYISGAENPFEDYDFPEATIRNAWLTVEQMRLLRDISLDGAMVRNTRDLIMLSYCLGGINMVDLVNIDFAKVRQTGVVKYERTKTIRMRKLNRYVEFIMPKEAWKYVTPFLHEDGHIGTPYQRNSLFHYYFSQCMGELRKQTGLDSLIYYSARKSFAQHAFSLGVSTSVIDFILGHKLNRGGTSLYNYIIVTPDMASDAIRLVLDNLK